MRRWDGNVIHYDWHLDRVVAAIRSAAQDPEKPAIADALSAAGRANQAVSFLMLDRGLAKGIREDLLELIARVQAALRKEASARQAHLSQF